MGSLDGIRVLDLSRVLAGPSCGQLLADNGAEVIKVEGPEGDLNRSFPTVIGNVSTNNLSVNRGKRGITLNLKSAAAREVLYRLVAKSDVVIQSFLPKVAARLGVDWEALSRVNPDLVHCTISGYGAKGPLREKPGYDMLVTAYAGIMSLTGYADRPPVRPGVTVVDLATGLLAYGGITSALLARARGQARGQAVTVSLLETAVHLLGFHGLNWLVGGLVDQREGAGYSALAPYDVYKAQDGEMLLGAPSEASWRKLCTIGFEDPALADDPRYSSNPERCRNAGALRADLEARLAHRPIAEWLQRFDAAGVPAAPIQTVDQVLEDPQVRANDMVVESPRADGAAVRTIGLPFKLSATPGAPGAAPPDLGQHTEAVLGELLGLDAAALADLRASGAL